MAQGTRFRRTAEAPSIIYLQGLSHPARSIPKDKKNERNSRKARLRQADAVPQRRCRGVQVSFLLFGYQVLRKYDGIYYISYKAISVEKSLAIQIVVASELPEGDECTLKVLEPKCDGETVKKTVENVDIEDERSSVLKHWFDVIVKKHKTLFKEAEMNDMEDILRHWEKRGLLAKHQQEWEQKGMREGMQKGINNVFALLENGYSVDEAKKKLQLA
jgi:hypothetical protein